ncbi:unnamed protein product [Lymnaea stagnalis]|uniref:Glomulin n=1 Tax=Lymnaea stagnalis TaxID=6523 RepID=A0AAV2HRH1_LYMST
MWAPETAGLEPPEFEKVDDPQQVLAQIIESLQQKDSHSLKKFILEHKLNDESIFWDLILKIGGSIDAETAENHPGFFDVCNRCLQYLIKVGNPKEILLALLEQMDRFIDDTKFKCFLPLIQTTVLKITTKLFHSLDTTLETVSCHLDTVPVPDNIQLEGEEIKLFHMDKTVVRLADILQSYLEFLQPFVEKIHMHPGQMKSAGRQEALVLRKHLIRVFDHPLCHLILTYYPESDKVKPDSRLCAELAMMLLSKVVTDFHKLFQYAKLQTKKPDKITLPEKKSEEEYDNEENEQKLNPTSESGNEVTGVVETWDFKMDISNLSCSCLVYLVHVEQLGIDKFPFIYRHDYTLEFHLDDIICLLKNPYYPINFKGLLLCQRLLTLVLKHSISSEYLDNQGYMALLNEIISIMINCPVRDHRTLATKIFPLFISKFDACGRYQIYQNVLSSCSHSGMKGYLITFLKNDIDESLKKVRQDQALNKAPTGNISETCFVGKRLQKILKLALDLPEKETTDMLENSDQIISALNLLRFLVIADAKPSNLTGFWNFEIEIESDFLSPLRRGLDLSKAHYELELDTLCQGRETNTNKNNSPEMSLSISGMSMSEMSKKEKIELIGKALNTHHIINSLICRVSELLEQQKFK